MNMFSRSGDHPQCLTESNVLKTNYYIYAGLCFHCAAISSTMEAESSEKTCNNVHVCGRNCHLGGGKGTKMFQFVINIFYIFDGAAYM